MDVKKRIAELEPQIIAWRREFHQCPELSYQETRTVQMIQEKLDEMGIPYMTMEEGHGVIGILDSGRPGCSVGLRADYDALAIQEDADVDFPSKNPGCMHACGHDAHVAMLLGAAKVLKECQDEWNGRVLLLFQAAEEVGGGWEEIVAGLEKLGGVDKMAGLHVWSQFPTGDILLRPGAVFGGSDAFQITMEGKGGHGARPDLTREPIKAACDLVLKLASIPSNFYNVLDPTVVSICMVSGGTAYNIFPDKAVMQGSMRYFELDGGDKIRGLIRRMADGVADTYGVQAKVETIASIIPVYNEAGAISQAKAVVEEMDELKLHMPDEPISAGDDFGMILQKYPGFFAILGCGNAEKGCCSAHHTSTFKLDEDVLRRGSEFLVRYSLSCLA